MPPLEAVKATIHVALKPWAAPNFAVRAEDAGTVEGRDAANGIPVRELSAETLNLLALTWLEDLYRKAGWTQPFAIQDGIVQERQRR